MALRIDIDRTPDGRWVASVPALGNLTRRATTRTEALRAVQVEALRRLAGELERGDRPPFGAFDVEPVEGPAVLALRSRAAETLRSLQQAATEDGLDELSEDDIEQEIRAARASRPHAPGQDTDPAAVKDG